MTEPRPLTRQNGPTDLGGADGHRSAGPRGTGTASDHVGGRDAGTTAPRPPRAQTEHTPAQPRLDYAGPGLKQGRRPLWRQAVEASLVVGAATVFAVATVMLLQLAFGRETYQSSLAAVRAILLVKVLAVAGVLAVAYVRRLWRGLAFVLLVLAGLGVLWVGLAVASIRWGERQRRAEFWRLEAARAAAEVREEQARAAMRAKEEKLRYPPHVKELQDEFDRLQAEVRQIRHAAIGQKRNLTAAEELSVGQRLERLGQVSEQLGDPAFWQEAPAAAPER